MWLRPIGRLDLTGGEGKGYSCQFLTGIDTILIFMATTARLLQLLSLLQTRRTWSGHELMERLEVSERTLRRDVERLRDLGYPVRATPGPAGGYQLEPVAEIPPLLLDEEEAIAIAVGLRTAAGGSITGIEDTSVRALAKLEQVLPPRSSPGETPVDGGPLIRPGDGESVATLPRPAGTASELGSYRAGRRHRERHVGHRLVILHRRWYLVAFDRDAATANVPLGRIQDPRPTRIIHRGECRARSVGMSWFHGRPMRSRDGGPHARSRDGPGGPAVTRRRDGRPCSGKATRSNARLRLIWFDVEFESWSRRSWSTTSTGWPLGWREPPPPPADTAPRTRPPPCSTSCRWPSR